jgi:hypothetical protein
MTATIEIPESGRGTAAQLLELQRLAHHSIVISVTRRCPLHCEHCIVSGGPEADGAILSAELATSLAGQLPQLREQGVRHLTFTGGEPVLALAAVRKIAQTAAAVGMTTALVTSPVWATSKRSADRVVERLSMITHWDLGFDRYHEAELPFERVERAVRALTSGRASFSIRACVDDPVSAGDLDLLRRLNEITGPGVRVYRQSVRRIGRARNFARLTKDKPRFPAEPCPSTGPFIREDGSVGPCCAGLAYESRGRHPFDFGDVGSNGLAECRKRWLGDNLLRMIRLVGFMVPLQWLDEAGMRVRRATDEPANVCELCVALWDENGEAASYLAARARQIGVLAQLDRLERLLFDCEEEQDTV